MHETYLTRLGLRRANLARKRQVVFGLVGGWLLAVPGVFRWLYVVNATPAVAFGMVAAGAALFSCAFVAPQLLGPVEWAARTGAGLIGKVVFGLILLLAYALVITPVGLLWRLFRGCAPFYSWTDAPAGPMEGWVPKRIEASADGEPGDARYRALLTQPLIVLGYFIRHRQFALIPIVLFLLGAGLVLFFVKSSALAPFIYSLF